MKPNIHLRIHCFDAQMAIQEAAMHMRTLEKTNWRISVPITKVLMQFLMKLGNKWPINDDLGCS